MSTRSKHLRTQVISLLSSGAPVLSHRRIAKTCGCSTKTVQRIQREIQPAMCEIAEQLQTSLRTVNNDWRFAKAWMYRTLNSAE